MVVPLHSYKLDRTTGQPLRIAIGLLQRHTEVNEPIIVDIEALQRSLKVAWVHRCAIVHQCTQLHELFLITRQGKVRGGGFIVNESNNACSRPANSPHQSCHSHPGTHRHHTARGPARSVVSISTTYAYSTSSRGWEHRAAGQRTLSNLKGTI